MTREEFIRRSMRSEARFIAASLDDRGTQTVSIGNWRCECGHEERSAAKMWDHRCVGCAGGALQTMPAADWITPTPPTEREE